VRGQAFFYSETGYQTTVDVVALAIRQGAMELPVLPVAFIIPRDTLLAIVYTRGEVKTLGRPAVTIRKDNLISDDINMTNRMYNIL
jgi:hypothetical protein